MTFDWKSYLELSSDLEKQATNSDDNREAKLRSSVSRAYYSAFHKARKLLCREIANFESNDYYRNHQAIIYQYESANEKTRKALGADLTKLRMIRNKSDYDNPYPYVIADDAEDAVLTAHEIIKVLDTLTPQPRLIKMLPPRKPRKKRKH